MKSTLYFPPYKGLGYESQTPFYRYLILTYNVLSKYGSIAQLGEHLPYKQGVTGSSPVTSTIMLAWMADKGFSIKKSKI